MKPLGRILSLHRYPVKGMQGECCDKLLLTEHGFKHDREWMFADREKERKGQKARLTARDGRAADILLFRPYWNDDNLYVETPEGEHYPIDSRKFIESLRERWSVDAVLRHNPRGNYDLRQVSLLSGQTVEAVSEAHGKRLDMRRFRPNIFFEWYDNGAKYENELIDETVRAGDTQIELVTGIDRGRDVDGIGRCKVITFNPSTLEQDIGLQTTVAKEFGNIVGVYGSATSPGIVRAGDEIYVE